MRSKLLLVLTCLILAGCGGTAPTYKDLKPLATMPAISSMTADKVVEISIILENIGHGNLVKLEANTYRQAEYACAHPDLWPTKRGFSEIAVDHEKIQRGCSYLGFAVKIPSSN